MKKYLLVFVLLLVSIPAFAIPQQLYFQGVLLNASGEAVTGNRDMTFKIYNIETGGTALWTEDHPGVAITRGLYTVRLGQTKPLTSSDFGGDDRWVEIQVLGDTPMTPRVKILSVPFAYRSATADSVSGSGIFFSTVTPEAGAKGFKFRTKNELNLLANDNAVFSVYSGENATVETLSVIQDDDAAYHLRGITIPPYYGTPPLYLIAGQMNGVPLAQLSLGGTEIQLKDKYMEFRAGDTIEAYTHVLRPSEDDTTDLGASDRQWKNVYAVQFHGDGSNLTGIVTGGAGDAYVLKTGDTMTNFLSIEAGSGKNGDLYVQNDIFGGSATINDSLGVSGLTTLNGSVYLGNNASKYIYINGVVNTNIVPYGLYNIGTPEAKWNHVYANYFHGDGSGLTNLSVNLSSYTAEVVLLGRTTAQTTNAGSAIYVETTDNTYGVYGKGNPGVYGVNKATASINGSLGGTDYAVYGQYDDYKKGFLGGSNFGVRGLSDSTYGGIFQTSSSEGQAVYGNAISTNLGKKYGGYFTASGDQGVGVRGEGVGSNGAIGGEFLASSADDGVGIVSYGSGLGASIESDYNGTAIYAKAGLIGVTAEVTNGDEGVALTGIAPGNHGIGVYGEGNGRGIYAVSSSVALTAKYSSGSNRADLGTATYAGSFEGSVHISKALTLQPSTGCPYSVSTPEGTIWYDDNDNKLKVYTTSWEALN